jgi:hypothetical protein
MALPLIPFAIKGAMIIGKMAFSKAAVAKATVATVKTIGVANSIAVCAVVGGIAWTAGLIAQARRAYDLAQAGDIAGAANELVAIAANIHDTSNDTLGDDLNSWLADGHPLDGRVIDLSKRCWSAAQSAQAA